MTVMVSEIKTFIILLPDIITKNWCILRMKMAWCTIRMAEMYLNYAEALVEIGELDKAKDYIDKVRVRAGIPKVDEAWDNFSTNPGYQDTKEGLREIVRQERSLEFYLEGQKFFDIRRWKIAEKFGDTRFRFECGCQ